MKNYFLLKIGKFTKFETGGIARYSKNMSWLIMARAITALTSLIATFYVARGLGPGNLGEINYAASIVGIFGFISTLGVDGVLNRELILSPYNHNILLGTAIRIRLISGTLATFLLMLYAFIAPHNNISLILIIILSLTHIASAFHSIQFYFLSKAESKYPSIVSIFAIATANLSKIICILMGGGVIWMAAIMFLEQVSLSVGYIYFYYRLTKFKLLNLKYNKKIRNIFLKTGFAVSFLTLFSFIYARIDQIMLNFMLGPESVGLYDPAVRLSELWNFIPGIIITALYPAIVNAKKQSLKLYKDRVIFLGATIFGLSLIISAVLSFLSPIIIKILYGPTFYGSISILKIYSWSCIGTFTGMYIQHILMTEDKRTILIIVGIIPMIINILLNYIWIPTFGVTGSAYATVVSYSITPLIPFMFKGIRNNLLNYLKML